MAVQQSHTASSDGGFAIAPLIGVGAGDFQHAVAAESQRILRETKGDLLAQHKLLDGMLRERGLITDDEVEVFSRLAQLGHDVRSEKRSHGEAYFEARDLYNGLLAGGRATPVALVIASSAVGSYEMTSGSDGSGTVVFKKSSGDWEGRGAKIGAVVGAFWGPAGAALGGLVGGAVGHAVDKCLD
jgi:hypothetical protein